MAFESATTIKHDVFVSFRGKDTRKAFTSHLRVALERNGIDVFTDKGLRAGEEISPALSSKITESQISVVVFSPNYADSRWCLDELVTIMECKAAKSQTVLPVFLQGVEPTHVRKQTGAFGDGFARLIQDARYVDKVKRWRRALKQAANLSGLPSDQISEGKIVDKLLNQVQSVLGQVPLDDSYKPFIGVERVDKVESILSLTEVRCLGLWGLPGSGKTTLAEKIFHHISGNFDGACFIDNVGKFAERHELNHLRRSLLSQLLGKHDQDQGPPIISRSDIQRKLKRKRVLVILDDVTNASQLQELIGDCRFFSAESKVIATSRDQQVLKNIGCDEIYEIQRLNDYESMQLIKLHIFKQRQSTPDQMELLKEAIKYAQGLPLALVVLGRNLFDKDVTIWKSELEKISDIPDLDIMEILRRSYDGLEYTEKCIFLDISCVMEGWKKNRAETILDSCKLYAARGIDRLVDKALITISNDIIHMHDLLKQMGQHIAFREGIKETGRPRRLWRNEEIADVLTQNQETEVTRSIEVISINLSKAASMKLRSRAFKKMTGLRILRFYNAFSESSIIALPEGLEYLPDGLRYLQWDLYPLPSLPPRFNLENLVELRMFQSNLRQLWTDEAEPCLPSLKHVDLSFSKKLTTFPNLRNASKLETLTVSFCDNLRSIPDSVQYLVELKYIDLSYTKRLTELPELSQLTKMETLHLMGCSKIRSLPQLPPNLIKLDLSSTKIKELPVSIPGLSQLEELWVNDCKELESVPTSIFEMKRLKQLDLSECPKLMTLLFNSQPPSIDRFSSLAALDCLGYKGDSLPSLKSLVSLNQLDFRRSNLKSLPEDIKYLTKLWEIDLSDCKSLCLIPELPPSLLSLDAFNCASLRRYTHRSSGEVDCALGLRPHPDEYLHLNFGNCLNLEQDARNEILRDFWLRVQSVSVPLFKHKSLESSKTEPLGDVCLPGNEVPEWFKYSEVESSIQVKTNSRRRPHHLRFILCAVVTASLYNHTLDRWLVVTCKCRTKSGETFYSECSFDFSSESLQPEREHTITWCGDFGPSQSYFNEDVLQFSAVMRFPSTIGKDSENDALIVKCGATPVGRTFVNKWLPVILDGSIPERASPVKRSEKRKHGNDEDEQPTKVKHQSK